MSTDITVPQHSGRQQYSNGEFPSFYMLSPFEAKEREQKHICFPRLLIPCRLLSVTLEKIEFNPTENLIQNSPEEIHFAWVVNSIGNCY